MTRLAAKLRVWGMWMFDERTIAAAFDEVSERFPVRGYMQSSSLYQLVEICRSLSPHLGGFKSKRLLDVGSGPMDKTAVLAQLGFAACATDDLGDPWHQLPGMRARIVDFARESGIAFHLQSPGDFSTPFEKGTFDVVTSIAVIEHIHDSPREIMNYMGEYLREGGLLVVAMPNAVNLRKRLSVLFGRTNYNPLDEMYFSIGSYRGHVREYTLAEAIHLCRTSGFEVIESRTFEHLAQQKLPSGVRSIYSLLGKIVPGFRSGLLVLARKPRGWTPVAEDPERYFQAIVGALPTAIAARAQDLERPENQT